MTSGPCLPSTIASVAARYWQSHLEENLTIAAIADFAGIKAFYAEHKKVTGKDAAQMKAYWSQLMFTGKAQKPKKVAGDDAVKKAVAATPGAIGYIDAAAVDASVKVVLKP